MSGHVFLYTHHGSMLQRQIWGPSLTELSHDNTKRLCTSPRQLQALFGLGHPRPCLKSSPPFTSCLYSRPSRSTSFTSGLTKSTPCLAPMAQKDAKRTLTISGARLLCVNGSYLISPCDISSNDFEVSWGKFRSKQLIKS